MEDPAVITALNHSGSLGRNFVWFTKINKNFIHQPRSVRIWKYCALCLEYRPWPTAPGGSQDHRRSFSQYGLPGWRITYISSI